MNFASNIMDSQMICVCCLSGDRRITVINDEDSFKLIDHFLGLISNTTQCLPLCWECGAVMRRIMRFRNQTVEAYNILMNNMPNKIGTFSNLKQTNLQMLSTEYVPESTNTIKIEHIDKHVGFVNVEPHFKMEDVGDFHFDETAEDEVDKEQVKENIDILDTTKTKEEFDESDEEPLKMKKMKQIDKKNKKGRRREKPAGVVRNARVAKQLRDLNVPSGALDMVVLSWDEVAAEREKALSSVTFTRHEYQCRACAVGFNYRCKLQQHMAKHEPSAGAAACDVCRVYCKDAAALSAHKRRHRVRWRCACCGSLWSRAGVAADHYARAHGGAAPTHTCAVCGHTAPTLGKLRNHLKNHAERQNCELCGKTFRDKTSLRAHLFIHRGEKEYACTECDKRFVFKKAMEIHRATHEASAHMYCHECDMNFKNRMSFYQHMKYNLKHVDPAKLKYVCNVCGKRFVKAVRLREHLAAVHLKHTPVKCTLPDCTFACASRPVLRTHIRVVHRHVRPARNHVCHACGKAYTSKKTLEGHLRAHSGERPYSCARCAAAFAYPAALYNHNKLVHDKHKGRGQARAQEPGSEVPPPAPGAPAAPAATAAPTWHAEALHTA